MNNCVYITLSTSRYDCDMISNLTSGCSFGENKGNKKMFFNIIYEYSVDNCGIEECERNDVCFENIKTLINDHKKFFISKKQENIDNKPSSKIDTTLDESKIDSNHLNTDDKTDKTDDKDSTNTEIGITSSKATIDLNYLNTDKTDDKDGEDK